MGAIKEDLSDVSSIEDDDLHLTSMPEFKRELLLAERHAEQLKKKQRKNLLRETSNEQNRNNIDIDDEFDEGIDYLEDGIDMDDGKDERLASEKVLFGDETQSPKEVVKYVTASLLNSARVSKSRALHILEHPNSNDYLYGVILNVYVSVGSDVEILGSRPIYITLPKLLGRHVIFQIDKAVKVPEYDVHGSKFSNCDHETRAVVGRCGFKLLGTVLSETRDSSNSRCVVSLSDICNEPITDEAINFGDERMAKNLQQIAHNLKCFTFTDEDVQLILERKLLERNKLPEGTYKGGRAGLINAIQRCSHEIELLVEAAKNDPSQLPRLAEHERKKQVLEEQLKKYKTTASTPVFFKNAAILRAINDTSSKFGVTRKTTKPTPMIMVTTSENEVVGQTETTSINQWKRSINEVVVAKQKHITLSYLNHVKELDINKWMTTKVNTESPYTNSIALSNYKKL